MDSTTIRKKAKRKRPDGGLNADLIIAEALALLDQDGLDGFSLRNLSKRLSVFPTAIYWHVPSRNELLARAVDAAFDLSLTGTFATWQEELRHIFREYRAAVRRHPNVAPLVGTQLVTNVGVNLELVEAILTALARAGFQGHSLGCAYNSVVATLVGFTTQEFAQMPSEDLADWQLDVRQRIEAVDPERYPTLGRNLPNLANKAFILRWQNGIDNPLDDGFDFSVKTLLAGLSSMVPATRPAARPRKRNAD